MLNLAPGKKEIHFNAGVIGNKKWQGKQVFLIQNLGRRSTRIVELFFFKPKNHCNSKFLEKGLDVNIKQKIQAVN